jgi:predicted NBD/HSP70 family sugar kinase
VLRVAISDLTGAVVAEQRMPLAADHRADTGMDRATELIHDMLDALEAEPSELLGVGLAIPAPIDPLTGQLNPPGLLRGWDEVRIAESMSRRLAMPVFVDKEANLAMLAESRYGAARGLQTAVFVYAGHTASAGIMIAGKVLHGSGGTAGEIGHIRVAENGLICQCGNRGCLNTVVNAGALLSLLRATHGNLTLRDLIRSAREGDVGAGRVVADAGTAIGVATAALCNVINPELVVVGGELGLAGPIMLAPMEAALDRATLHGPGVAVATVLSELADDGAVRGALALALDSVSLSVPRSEITP